MNMSLSEEDILNDIVTTRNLSKRSYNSYKTSINSYQEYMETPLWELIEEAESEEETGIRWKFRKLKKRLIEYRAYLYSNYSPQTARTYFGRICSVYRHFEIEIHDLPKFSERKIDNEPINFSDLPDKDVIRQSLQIATPILRAIILFIVSSGCARAETMSLTIQDLLDSVSEYYQTDNVYDMIKELRYRKDIIPIFKLKRQKTNKYYYTFCTPEAFHAICDYILSIKKTVKSTDKLFQLNPDRLITNFRTINNVLHLGLVGKHGRFRTHMLRKYNASQLYNDGLPIEDIDALQGRGKSKTHQSYFMEDPKKLKEKYIAHMDCLLINTNVIKFNIKSSEYKQMEEDLLMKQNEVDELNSRMDDLEKLVLGGISEERLSRLMKYL